MAIPAGLAGPTTGPPARRAASMRRTSNLDLLPHADGSLEIRGRARDLTTDAAGGATTVGSGLLRLLLDPDRTVAQASAHPADVGVLVGRSVRAGFRTAIWRHLRPHYDAASPLHLLLDDVPGGLVISGFTARRVAPNAGGAPPPVRRRRNVCIGWADGSDAVRRMERDGHPPPPDWNPPAPDGVQTDPHARHTEPALPPLAMRRARRLDVWPAPGGGVDADVGFRDVFTDDTGTTRVLHEYRAAVSLDAAGTVTRCDATPHVLPHVECPLAAASARRVVGAPSSALRESVSMDFFGPSTCTHLNDLLRGLSDLPTLARAVHAPDLDDGGA